MLLVFGKFVHVFYFLLIVLAPEMIKADVFVVRSVFYVQIVQKEPSKTIKIVSF